MKKLVMALITILVLILGISSVSTAEQTEPVMEKVNVLWDLKPDVPVTVYFRYAGLERYIPNEVTVSILDRTEKNGTITLKLSYTVTADFTLTDDEIRQILVSGNKSLNNAWAYCVVDYNTGMCLENRNDKHVTVKHTYRKKDSKSAKLTTSNNETLEVLRVSVHEITITYPKDYNGLCFGALGYREHVVAELFWNGKYPFNTTSYFDNNKPEVSHFMRINNEI